MKKKATITLLFAATVGAQSAAIHSGLVNYWTLDGNGADTAGNFLADGATSTLNDAVAPGGTAGAATILSTGGLFGGAGDFERTVGADGRLAAADSVDVDFTDQDLTTSLWVQFDDNTTRWQAIIAKGEREDYRIATIDRSNNAGYAGGTGDIDSGVNVRDTAWHHILTTTTEGGATQIYVDGALAATGAGPASIDFGDGNPNNNELYIGNNPDNGVGGSRMWDGLIDDVAQWDRVLTAAEVTEIYTAGLAGTELGAIPEPSSVLLLGLSSLVVLRRRR